MSITRTARLVASAMGSMACLFAPAHCAASPPDSGGFSFVAVAVGDSSVTVPMTIASPSIALAVRVRMDAEDTCAFSIIMPDTTVKNAAAIVAAGGKYIDLTALPTLAKVDAFMQPWIPEDGRIVTILLPGPLAPGTYTLRADYGDPLTEVDVFQVNWDTHEELQTQLSVSHSVVFVNNPVVIAAAAVQGQTPITGATVTGFVVPPDEESTEEPITLLDNGTVPDGTPNDGVYAAQYTPTDVGDHLVRVTVSGTTLGSMPFSRTLLAGIDVRQPGGKFSGAFVPRVVRNEGNKATAVELDVPVMVYIAGRFSVSAVLRSPLGNPYEVGVRVDLEPGPRVVTLSLPITALPSNPENGVYRWENAVLLGPTSRTAWKLDELATLPEAQSEVLLNEGDWIVRPVHTVQVTWQTADPDEDNLYDELIAVVTVKAQFGGEYTARGTLVGYCNHPRDMLELGRDTDVQTLIGSVPGQFFLRFKACDLIEPLGGVPFWAGIGPSGISGPYDLINLYIAWTDDLGPQPYVNEPFDLNTRYPSPAYWVGSFECHEHMRDANNNGITDMCDIQSGTSEDANANGIPDEAEPPACPPACNLADITDIGGGICPDGQLTLDDIIAFVNAYNDGEGCPGLPPCNLADITGIGGPPSPPDGQLTFDDIMAFVNAYNDGCPGAEG